MKGNKRVLLLGSSGKMGIALRNAFEPGYQVICRNSGHFDASALDQVESVINDACPDIVVNTVAMLGIDACEKNREEAFRLNALYPKFLAGLSREREFLLVHFSTDAVFNDEKKDYYVESDRPSPLNVYGATKYRGDCFVQAIAEKYYLIRVSLLFGPAARETQFVEKMLSKIHNGATELRIAHDIVLTPSYSVDIASEVRRMVEGSSPSGLYHVCNQGMASLYDLTKKIVDIIHPGVHVTRASCREFPSAGLKNTFTPLRSEKIGALRPWEHAVEDYCANLTPGKNDER